MPTSVNVHEPSPHDRASALAGKGIGRSLSKLSERVAIGLLIAIGVVWLAVGTIYLDSLVGPVDPPDAEQFFVGP